MRLVHNTYRRNAVRPPRIEELRNLRGEALRELNEILHRKAPREPGLFEVLSDHLFPEQAEVLWRLNDRRRIRMLANMLVRELGSHSHPVVHLAVELRGKDYRTWFGDAYKAVKAVGFTVVDDRLYRSGEYTRPYWRHGFPNLVAVDAITSFLLDHDHDPVLREALRPMR